MEGNVTDTLCERRKGDKFDGSFDKEDRSQNHLNQLPNYIKFQTGKTS